MTPSWTALAFTAAVLLTAARAGAAAPPPGQTVHEVLSRDRRVLKTVRLGRREETVDGRKYRSRAGLVRIRSSSHTVVFERTEDAAVEDRSVRRSSPTTLVSWFGPDGPAAAPKRFGGRFEPVALADSGMFMAGVDSGYDDIPIHQGLSPAEAREARALSESRLYVFDRSWRALYSTAALRGAWHPVHLSPQGGWLVFDNQTAHGSDGERPWHLTAVELATGRTFQLAWERDLAFLKPEDDGAVTAQRFLGLTTEKFPVKMPDGSTMMQPNAVYVKLRWKPGSGKGFLKAD